MQKESKKLMESSLKNNDHAMTALALKTPALTAVLLAAGVFAGGYYAGRSSGHREPLARSSKKRETLW